MSEQKIQTKCIEYLQGLGAYVFKVVLSTKSGVPDLIVCYKGLFLAFEIKDEDGEVSALQTYNINKIKEAGGKAFVIRSLIDLIEVMENVKKNI